MGHAGASVGSEPSGEEEGQAEPTTWQRQIHVILGQRRWEPANPHCIQQ
jgi:hypothetical protein